MTETINQRLADMAGLEPGSLTAFIANYALRTGEPEAFFENLDRYQCGEESLYFMSNSDRCKMFFDDYYEDIPATLFDLRLNGNLPEIDIEHDLRSWLAETAFFAIARRMALELGLIEPEACAVRKCTACGETKSSIRFDDDHDPRRCLTCVAQASDTRLAEPGNVGTRLCVVCEQWIPVDMFSRRDPRVCHDCRRCGVRAEEIPETDLQSGAVSDTIQCNDDITS